VKAISRTRTNSASPPSRPQRSASSSAVLSVAQIFSAVPRARVLAGLAAPAALAAGRIHVKVPGGDGVGQDRMQAAPGAADVLDGVAAFINERAFPRAAPLQRALSARVRRARAPLKP